MTAAGAAAARPVERVSGNTTGAGDAACAAVARALAMAGSVRAVEPARLGGGRGSRVRRLGAAAGSG